MSELRIQRHSIDWQSDLENWCWGEEKVISDQVVEVEKLQILSVNRLADILKIPKEKLVSLSATPELNYSPFLATKPPRPFQKAPIGKPRPIDNPLKELRFVQQRIYRRLLKPICLPPHVLGAVPKRSVRDNADRHLHSSLLVTLDIKQCFPSITNVHIYNVWRHCLDCSTPVASLLTKLTTFQLRLPQGAATSPLLANLFIWMIDEPIRRECAEKGVDYSTWIDDLAFSGERARELIQVAASTLSAHGLRVSRRKIRVMGPSTVKNLTGTRLGLSEVRAPKDKLGRIRSGIHKLRTGLVQSNEEQSHINGLVGQLRFIRQIAPRDALPGLRNLRRAVGERVLSNSAKELLGDQKDAKK
jgi:RNA-directed DNA polymerase